MSPSVIPVVRTVGDLARVQDSVKSVVDPLATRLNQTPIMGAPPPVWSFLEPYGGITVFVAAERPAWLVDALGYTQMVGRVIAVGGAAASTAFLTLPLEARPGRTLVLPATAAGAANAIQISTAGVVSNFFALGAGEQLWIDGIHFLAGA